MLTAEDCIDLCELTAEEVEAIADHEHIPMIIAAELGNYLIHTESGEPMIHRFILDDIEMAESRGDTARVSTLKLTLKHFLETHPQAGS